MVDITFEAEGIGTDFAHNANGRLYVIPQDPTTKEILLNVNSPKGTFSNLIPSR